MKKKEVCQNVAMHYLLVGGGKKFREIEFHEFFFLIYILARQKKPREIRK